VFFCEFFTDVSCERREERGAAIKKHAMSGEGTDEAVPVWTPDQSIETAFRAKMNLKEECVNHLKTVGLVMKSPEVHMEDADNFHAAGRYNEERFKNEIFSPEEKDVYVRFSGANGQKGMVMCFWGEHTTLEVWRAKSAMEFAKPTKLVTGTRKEKDSKLIHAENLTKYSTGEVYGGAGFFTDPRSELDEAKTGDARLFFSPLCAFAITVEYHPTKTMAVLGRQRRFPVIINYRIDGLFSTTFSTSWQVIHTH
jgi:hypothetical protein